MFDCSSATEILKDLESMNYFGLERILDTYADDFSWDENKSMSENLKDLAKCIDSFEGDDRKELAEYIEDMRAGGYQKSSSFQRLSKTLPQGNRKVYFVQRTVMQNGQYVVCIAEEGTKGYSKTDWLFGSNFNEASKLCNEKNEQMGISEMDALMIQSCTMKELR